MKDQHRFLLNVIRTNSSKFKTPLQDQDDETLVRMVFLNYRENPTFSTGMRLTYLGLEWLERCFNYYQIPLEEQWDHRDMLFMDRNCALPYHLGYREVTVFDRMWAARLRLSKSITGVRQAYG